MADETSETIVFNLFLNNTNMTNSASIPCRIQQITNTLVEDLSKWNLYINSITLSTGELPYMNVKRMINWNNANYATNKMNLSITLYDNTGYNFDLTGNTNLLVSGVDVDPGNANLYKGVAVFLQYLSENVDPSLYPDPNNTGTGANSANYPITYFNVHSIQQMLDFINTAITTAKGFYTPVIADPTMYFLFNPTTQLYSLYMSEALKISGVQLYFNSFLEKFIDGFRVTYLKDTDVVNEIPYRGMSFLFNKTNYPINQDASGVWTYTAEADVLQNLLDIHSLIILTDGDLGVVRRQVFQNITTENMANNVNPPLLPIMKSLDFLFNGNIASVNNSTINFEAQSLDRPINIHSNSSLQNIQLDFKILNVYGDLLPLSISANGLCNIKFCLKKRVKII